MSDNQKNLSDDLRLSSSFVRTSAWKVRSTEDERYKSCRLGSGTQLKSTLSFGIMSFSADTIFSHAT